jgi:hypothetical protein
MIEIIFAKSEVSFKQMICDLQSVVPGTIQEHPI